MARHAYQPEREDHWDTNRDLGEREVYRVAPPEGHVIAWRNRAWRVEKVLPPSNGEETGTWAWVLRPALPGPGEDGTEYHEGTEKRSWRVLPTYHFAVCNHCGEPVPCRRLRELWEKAAIRRAERDYRALVEMGENVCWGCREPITARQKIVRFPGDPPAQYHIGRVECRVKALDYQENWVEAEEGREPLIGWHDPYSGRPTGVQRRLLAQAARGELGCHMTHVTVPDPDEDLLTIMKGTSANLGYYVWAADSLPRDAHSQIPPLIEAGLLAEPAEPDPDAMAAGALTRAEHVRHLRGMYRLTGEGRETHRRYPPRDA